MSSCQEQMSTFQVLVKSLKSWIKETTERVPVVQPSFGAEDLQKSLEETKVNHCPYLIPSSRLLVSGRAGFLFIGIGIGTEASYSC